MSIETLTFGCRLNTYESEVMRAEAEKGGLSNALIVNTCAVTAEAVRQAKQAIRAAQAASIRGGRSSSPAVPRRPRRGHSGRWPRSISSSAMPTR